MFLSSQSFIKAVKRASKALPTRPEKPIRGCLKFVQNAKQLTIFGSNRLFSFKLTLACEGEDLGTYFVPAKKLLKALVGVTGDRLELNVAESQLIINDGDKTVAIDLHTSTDVAYPELPEEFECGSTMRLSSKQVAFLKNVSTFASDFSTTKIIMGVSLKNNAAEGVVEVVATNGYCLAQQNCTIDGCNFDQIIILAKPLTLLDSTEVTQFLVSKDSTFCCLNQQTNFYSVETTILLLSGNYPDYGKLYQTGCKQTFVVTKKEILSSLVAFRKKIEKDDRVVNLVAEGASSLALKKRGSDDKVIVNLHDGKPTFNMFVTHQYLAECLNALSAGNIKIEAEHPYRPLILTDKDGLTIILMPARG